VCGEGQLENVNPNDFGALRFDEYIV